MPEELYQAFFRRMSEKAVICELVSDDAGSPVDYRIVECNEAFARTAGIAREDAPGTSGSLLYNLSPPPYLSLYAGVARSGQPCSFTDQYSEPGKVFSVSVVSPREGFFAATTGDITELMGSRETLLSKNRELEKYLYIASHDLRSPLVNIQGFSTRLRKQAATIRDMLDPGMFADEEWNRIDAVLAAEIPRSLDFIFTNVNKMDKLINGLLQISRTGRIALAVRRIDMNALIKNILDSLAFETDQARADVVAEPLEPCFGDEQLLNQLFSNIVGNAVKYRDPERPLRIHIACVAEKLKNVYSVRDNGIGIDARHRDRVWDVFYRGDNFNGPAGDGIGLSLVKRIAERHKGRVSLESVKGEGSVFYIELPSETFVEDE